MFKYKTNAELSAMTADEVEAYTVAKRSHESALMAKAIEEAVKDLPKTESVTKATDAVKQLLTEEVAKLQKQFDTAMEAVNVLKDQGVSDGALNVAVKVAKEIKDKKDEIKSLTGTTDLNKEVVLKTLVQRSAISNNQQAYDVPDIGQLATRKLTLYDLFPKVQLGENNNGTVRYYDWDAGTIARAAAAIAENGTFPASTAAWAKYSIDLKKIGDTLPVTEEFFEDEVMFANELGMFLETNVNIEVDSQLATGDGTSNKLTGIVSSSTAYTPVAAGIITPSIYDLVKKMSETITKSYGSKYVPNFALMNITDINRMQLTKDVNHNYVMPPFVSRDGNVVAGITVIECNAITANTMVVGDNRYARIYEKPGVVLSKGFTSTQFVEDAMTLKARKRMLFLIRTVDKTGFLYCSDIDAALVTLAL